MLDYFLTSPDGWAAFKVVAVSVPVLVFIWITMTVMALHKRDVYFGVSVRRGRVSSPVPSLC